MADVRKRHPDIDPAHLIPEVNRRLIARMIEDAVAETQRRLDGLGARSPDDIRAAGAPVVAFSEPMNADCDALRAFLFSRVYRHPRITTVMTAAQTILTRLFARYMDEPAELPEKWLSETDPSDRSALARHVCDFIAGMTDRYALREHQRLFDATPELI
jgi:dGTPase